MTENGSRLVNAVFVDASAFFAIFNENDAQHRSAAVILDRLLDVRRALVTTNVVIAETHALLLSKIGHAVARRVLAELYSGEVRIVRVTEADEEAARAIIARYTDKSFSYADAMSFVVMDRFGIREAFTFDHHFRQYGLTVVEPA